MGAWNTLTAVRRLGEGGTGWNKVKEVAKEHVCITHRRRQQCGDGQREEEVWWNRDICNIINNKNKEKKKKGIAKLKKSTEKEAFYLEHKNKC